MTLAVLLVAGVFALPASPAAAFQIEQDRVVSDDPVNWTPNILDGQVTAIVQVGNRMIVAGAFSQVRNAGSEATLTRNNILAFGATTGTVDTGFSPDVNGKVNAMVVAPDGGLIIGGGFTQVDGTTVNRVAKLNPNTGAPVGGFSARAGAVVQDLALAGDQVVVGGAFSTIGGVAREHLAAISAANGDVDPAFDLPVTGEFNGGSTNVRELDVSPDGSRLVIIGNFRQVAGLTRVQIAQIDLQTTPASVADWRTTHYEGACADVFNTYMRDVEYSPDGAYFVAVSTGAGFFPSTLCDTAARWETGATGSAITPTWVGYSGGDTYTAVAITGTAIYVGGHMRWLNNAPVGDVAAEGAVVREGIGALDPQNGMPLRWNPGRGRGVGVFSFLATPDGLWVGDDTDRLSGELRQRIGLFPLEGGTAVPKGENATLPGTLHTMEGSTCSGPDTSILHRVNAGGPVTSALDCGPQWQADQGTTSPLRNSGSNTASAPINSVHTSVPASTPPAVFGTERWDPSAAPEMQWNLPVPVGTQIQVRLYLANTCTCTDQVGERRFSVRLDGTQVLTNYDLVADVGHAVGRMHSWNVTSDGSATIDFLHVTENPLVNAIEIVDRDAPTGPVPTAPESFTVREFDGATAGPDATLETPGDSWGSARGAFVLEGKLYAGWSDGRLYSWPFDGAELGDRTDVLQQGEYVLGPGWISFGNVTGMFWRDGKLFHTLAGDDRLFFRYFSPESELVGSVRYVASGPGVDGMNWSDVRGMTEAGDRIFWATSTGDLRRVDLVNGAPMPGSATTIGGPGIDGRDWRSTGMWIAPTDLSDSTPPTTPGTPTGVAAGSSSIDLTWEGSADDESTQITYRIYRDGGAAAVGEVTSAAASVAFTDSGLQPESTHTYEVDAVDGEGNESSKSAPSDPITTDPADPDPDPDPELAFSDDFASGDFAKWSQVRGELTIDTTRGDPAAPSARMQTTDERGQATADLPDPMPSACVSVHIQVDDTGGTGLDLLRLRTADGGSITKLYVSQNGMLRFRSDFASEQRSTRTSLSGGWNVIELCGATGGTQDWNVWLNGDLVLEDWAADGGPDPIEQIQIGDGRRKTATANWDDVVVDTEPGTP
ncbi:MAG: malectin domain-containing carbohydrate-binding protein [Actinomycetota bacterium]